jgi:hypothetical protein
VSNVFKGQGVLFVPVPAVVMDVLKDMSEAEIRLYLFLLRLAQKHSAVEISSPALEVHDHTGLHSETVAIARRKLEKRNLLCCKKGVSGLTVYVLMNPLTGTALPAPQGFKGTRAYESKGRSARTARSTPKPVENSPVVSIPWTEIGQPTTKKTCPGDGSTVSAPRINRHRLTDQPSPDFSELHANTNTCEAPAPRSEESLKKGISEVGGAMEVLGPEKTGAREKRRVKVRKVKVIEGERLVMGEGGKSARTLAKNPHADDGRGYPASWDDLDDSRPEWTTPTFEVVAPQSAIDWKGLAANDR